MSINRTISIFVAAGFIFAGILSFQTEVHAAGAKPSVTVFKSPYCGCCEAWVGILRENGYDVMVNDREDMEPVKNQAGVPDDLQSCHTAAMNGYVIEGHVPVSTLERLADEKPSIRGISVPGMPAGSPGMGGEASEPLTVYSFNGDGGVSVFDKPVID